MRVVVMRIQTAMRRRIRWQNQGLSRQPNQTTTITTKHRSDTESDQLDWDPERFGHDGCPLVDENAVNSGARTTGRTSRKRMKRVRSQAWAQVVPGSSEEFA